MQNLDALLATLPNLSDLRTKSAHYFHYTAKIMAYYTKNISQIHILK
jgi:hypothetical protein